MRRYNPFHNRADHGKIIIYTGLFAIIGAATLLLTRAATPFASLEGEGGTRTGNAQSQADSQAAQGSYVQFGTPPTTQPSTMQLVSRGRPLFTATNQGSAEQLRDTSTSSSWDSGSLPTWAALDLSGLTVTQKESLLVAMGSPSSQDYYINPVQSYMRAPSSYVIEGNAAAGGGQPPSSSWVTLASDSNNLFNAPQKVVNFSGYNWLRVRITAAGGASSVGINLAVYSVTAGQPPANDWLFMGDSITAISYSLWTSDIPNRVATIKPNAWPEVVPAGLGGTSTVSAQSVIDIYLAAFPGKYVVLGYGANDGASNFQMESLVQKVIAAGKTPVVHTTYYDPADDSNNQQLNAQIANLYTRYPQILPGPDMYALTRNRTDYFPNIHPSDAGVQAIRGAWASFIAAQNP